MGGDVSVSAGGPAGGVKAAKEAGPKERINEITKTILGSQELKDFEAALKEHGVDHIEFGNPAKQYNVPFSAKDKEAFARALATLLDTQLVIPNLENPKAPPTHDTPGAKQAARDYLSGQTQQVGNQEMYPAEADVKLTVATPDYSPQTMDFSGD